MKIFRTILIFSAFLLLASKVFAEDLVLYETITERKQFHLSEKNKVNDVGVVTAIGDVRFLENGPIIGQFFQKVTVLHVNEKDGFDMRERIRYIHLPEGDVYIMVHSKQTQLLVQKGDKYTGIILGGTGKYAGIRGTFDFDVTGPGDLGQIRKSVLHIQR
jgi:hypothetical protein